MEVTQPNRIKVGPIEFFLSHAIEASALKSKTEFRLPFPARIPRMLAAREEQKCLNRGRLAS